MRGRVEEDRELMQGRGARNERYNMVESATREQWRVVGWGVCTTLVM